ncbi:DUF914 domain membrane protein [Aspergillus heteromorphus CBS 117.55]|uniref:DUF914 domain membrane protein n=1 Tax=Aspergillus heteromorphus CBS 117.55 TaxID=1448321 RepID=A0A317VIR0_9EURO|nr:DUF914 domain membrane protein [Aspergillus heteromorphus CBS 117.55]PWY72908.1 DUF914 domain membrane protein [Aspergillus heteromorphus CBS 117.55]
MADAKARTAQRPSSNSASYAPIPHSPGPDPSVTGDSFRSGDSTRDTPPDQGDTSGSFLAYFTTKEFFITLLLGQVLAITNTACSTFSTLLANEGTSIPAFQTFFNYLLLNLIFTPYTIYRYGTKGWLEMVLHRGWKYVFLSFCDVEGNYFIVLAYRYTTMLSAQLINFWAIAVVVLVSSIFLRVRYHNTQVLGILICIGGMGVLIASDHLTGSDTSTDPNRSSSHNDQIKGDIFALLGATFYGLANTAEEFLVSTAPVYEVLGQMALYGTVINGLQAGIFGRSSFDTATWNSHVAVYLVGYTFCLAFFYCMAPLLLRLSSAAFFNISMLTMNFWGVVIGIAVFRYTVHWAYPIAFLLITVGQLIYYVGRRVLGEARKPWLGRYQERGVSGVFTARRKIESQTNMPRAK